jgi:hypothetical protein
VRNVFEVNSNLWAGDDAFQVDSNLWTEDEKVTVVENEELIKPFSEDEI